jgi:[ribosomal protein S18]-alanine N-acetyltransferase
VYFFTEPMRESDIARIQEIERQSFSSPWSASTYLRELRSPDECRYIVARASTTKPRHLAPPEPTRRGWLSSLLPGLFASSASSQSPYMIAGYGGVWLTVNEGHITTIATAPEMRRRGVGELVLNGLIDAARDLGAEVLTLEVRVSNTAAQKLYLKYGFAAKGVRRRYYTDNNEDALIMWTERITTSEYQARLHTLRTQLAERLGREAMEDRRQPTTDHQNRHSEQSEGSVGSHHEELP